MSTKRPRLATAALSALGVLVASALLTIVGHADSARSGGTLRVFAAASLADAFGDLAKEFERTHAGVSVQFNLAGSQALATQIEHGARADLFASADERWMDHLRQRSLLAGDAQIFARNRLIVIVPRTNPARIGRLQDLARRGLKLVLGAEAVPVGRYSRDMLANLGRRPGFEPDFAQRVLANVVSEEENVKAVVAKVQLGEADAGIVYRSDVTASLARFVRTFEVPDSANVLAAYPIAVLQGAALPDAAKDFVALVLSSGGQRVLLRRGLVPVAATTR